MPTSRPKKRLNFPLFGWLTDRLGRSKLFFITLGLYVGATAAAFSFNLESFLLFRFLTGMGIGGSYTAINSPIGALLGLDILVMRLWLPESPRWLLIHGQPDEAKRIVEGIGQRFVEHGHELPAPSGKPLRLHARDHTPLREIFHTLFISFRRRSLVGLTFQRRWRPAPGMATKIPTGAFKSPAT